MNHHRYDHSRALCQSTALTALSPLRDRAVEPERRKSVTALKSPKATHRTRKPTSRGVQS